MSKAITCGSLLQFSVLSILFLLIPSVPVQAGDGVLEINQNCVASGCFPGDQIGFPVQIYNGGSYILTSDLDVTGEENPHQVTAIEILLGLNTVEGTHIDLNGFRIIGPNIGSCDAEAGICDNEGIGVGIKSIYGNITVRNGSIMGMGNDGIQIGAESRVEDMRLINNAGDGIDIALRSMVLGNICFQNAENGIRADGFSFVKDNLSTGNGGRGLDGVTTTGFSQNVFAGNFGDSVDEGFAFGDNYCPGVCAP